jgi:hypothetical protein
MLVNPWDKVDFVRGASIGVLVDADHPLEPSWIRDDADRYGLSLKLSIDLDSSELPSLKGLELVSNPASEFIRLILKNQKDWELFLNICKDLIESTRSHEKTNAKSCLVSRLFRWQEFLRRDSSELSEPEIKGLIGELYYLTQKLAPYCGLNMAVDYWVGPEGSPQDFLTSSETIEIKSQIGSSLPTVKISSIDQLCTQAEAGYLFVITLSKVGQSHSEALNILTMIDQIKDGLIDVGDEPAYRNFCEKLIRVGFHASSAYMKYNFAVLKENSYLISGQFPRLCRSDIPQGVEKVSYTISLDACKQFKGKPNWMN